MRIEIRQATADELLAFREITAYSYADNSSEAELAASPSPMMPEWTLCAFVDGRMATTFEAFPFRARLNGEWVAMAGVAGVATLPEFRRTGLLRATMTQALSDQRDRGEAFAILHASLGAIYQRYGFGMATSAASYQIDPRHIVFVSGEPAAGRVRICPKDEALPVVQQIYKEFARPRNLMLLRAPVMWDLRVADRPGNRTRFGIYYRDGEPRGYVIFVVAGTDVSGPGVNQSLDMNDAAWLDRDAYRGMWEFFASHDLACRVRWGNVPEDDPAPLLMQEPRMLQRKTQDDLWMRVTDVEAALRSRPYGEDGCLTIAVHDSLCDWNERVLSVESAGTQRDVRPTGAEPDLVMPVASLAVLLSGHRSATVLARAGLVAGDASKLRLADRMFATTYAPWCPDGF